MQGKGCDEPQQGSVSRKRALLLFTISKGQLVNELHGLMCWVTGEITFGKLEFGSELSVLIRAQSHAVKSRLIVFKFLKAKNGLVFRNTRR